MTANIPHFAIDPTLPGDDQATAVKARVALFCNVTGDEPVKLKVRAGKVYMTDDLLEWCKLTGANLDWLIFGDLRAMIRVCRQDHEAKKPAMEVIKQIPKDKLSMFTAALKAHGEGLLPLDQALLALRQALGIDEATSRRIWRARWQDDAGTSGHCPRPEPELVPRSGDRLSARGAVADGAGVTR